MVATVFGVSSPLASASYWETVLSAVSTTYTLRPSGLTATPTGSLPVATVAGGFGGSCPLLPTLYSDTVSSEEFVTYRLLPFGLLASSAGSVPASTVARESPAR